MGRTCKLHTQDRRSKPGPALNPGPTCCDTCLKQYTHCPSSGLVHSIIPIVYLLDLYIYILHYNNVTEFLQITLLTYDSMSTDYTIITN